MTDQVNGVPDDVPSVCGTCLCYIGVNETGGLCRRNPPQVVVMMVPDPTPQPAVILKPGEIPRQKMIPQPMSQWPPVPIQGWCFEYVDPREEGFDAVQLATGRR